MSRPSRALAILAGAICACGPAVAPADAKPKSKARADLVVVKGGVVFRDGLIDSSAQIKNRGTATAGLHYASLYLQLPGRRVEVGRGRLSPIKPGRTRGVLTRRQPLPVGSPAGSFDAVLCADSLGLIRELSETNNCKRLGRVTVPPAPPVTTPPPATTPPPVTPPPVTTPPVTTPPPTTPPATTPPPTTPPATTPPPTTPAATTPLPSTPPATTPPPTSPTVVIDSFQHATDGPTQIKFHATIAGSLLECAFEPGATPDWYDCTDASGEYGRFFRQISLGEHVLWIRATSPTGTVGAILDYRFTVSDD